jgi:hypothetical protein
MIGKTYILGAKTYMSNFSDNEKPVAVRRVVRHGGSLYICIPNVFAVLHNIKPGDHLPIIIGANSLKIVMPDRD